MAAPDDAPFMHRPRCTWKCLGARIWGTGASSTPAKPRYDAVSVTWRYLNAGAPSGIRTHTGSGLSRLPLPVGLSGPASDEHDTAFLSWNREGSSCEPREVYPR